jgi:hypothetical protein
MGGCNNYNIGGVVMGAFSVMLYSMRYAKQTPDEFDSIVKSLLVYEDVCLVGLEDLLWYEKFYTYHKNVSSIKLPHKTQMSHHDMEGGFLFDDEFIGALLMLDILLELSPINSVPCIHMLHVYFTHHHLPYNPIVLRYARQDKNYTKRRKSLATVIRNGLASLSLSPHSLSLSLSNQQ